MRVTPQSMNLDDARFRDVTVEVLEEAIPAIGDAIVIEDEVFRVLAVYPLGQLNGAERAVVLTVRRDDLDPSGVPETLGPGPSTLTAGAEAEPPPEDPSDAPPAAP